MPRLLTIFNQNRENNAGDIEKFAGDNRQCASEKKYYEFLLSLSVIPVCGFSGFDMEQPSITMCCSF